MKYKHFPFRIVSTVLLSFFWITVMFASAIQSITSSGLSQYIGHFTNWAWTLQMLFFYFFIIGWLSNDTLFRLTSKYIFLPIWGVSWIVFGLVLALVFRSGKFVMRYLVDYRSGEVFFGNALYHYIPPIVFTAILAGTHKELILVFHEWINIRNIKRVRYYLICIYAIVSPLFIVGIFCLIYDFKKVYDTDMTYWEGLLISSLISLIVNGMTFVFLTSYEDSVIVMYKSKKELKEN